jgi:hypothetical protein
VPGDVDKRALAEFVLTTMEGGVMLARSYRDIGYFDRAIGELKGHFNRLLRRPGRRPAAGHNDARRRFMPEVNWLAVLTAAISSFLLGGLWYSPAMFFKACSAARDSPTSSCRRRPSRQGVRRRVRPLAHRRGHLRDVPRQDPGRAGDGLRLLRGLTWVAASFGINTCSSARASRSSS